MGEMTDDKKSAALEGSLFKVLSGFLILFMSLAFVWLLKDLLAPVFMGFLLAMLFIPIIDWMQQHWNMPPWLSITLVLLILALTISGLTIWLLPLVYEQISDFLKNLPDNIDRLFQAVFHEELTFNEDINRKISEAAQNPEKIVPTLLKGSIKSLAILVHTFSAATYIIIYTMLLLAFFVGFCLNMSRIKGWLWQFLPHSQREHIGLLSYNIYEAAATFFRTRLMIALILSISFSIGWAIAGVPYWLLLGIAAGILNIIPYASVLVWIAALLFNVLDAGNTPLLYAVLWPTLVYWIVELTDGWLLTPWLQGGKLHIHPLMVLFAVFAGAALGGLLGMLLAIPITAAAQIVFSDVIKPRLTDWAREH